MKLESRADLRARIAALRKAIPAEARRERAAVVVRLLREHAWLREARVVAAYAAHGAEVPVLDAVDPDVQVVALPRTEGATFTLHRWDGGPLAPGTWRVLEPAKEAPIVAIADVDVWLIPGIAFDRSGARLGRGAGHYDRVLAGAKGRRVGVCWREQVVERIPTEPHDVPMDAVVTDEGLWLV